MSKITNNKFFGGMSNFISQNIASLSMFGGLLCFGGALYAAYKASEGVHKINEDYKEEVQKIEAKGLSEGEKKAQMKDAKGHKITSILFLEKYAIGLAVVGAALEVYSNYANGLTIAGLAGLVATKQDEIKTWVKNTKENLTPEKFEEIKGKSLEELISRNFTTDDGPVIYSTILKKGPNGESYAGDVYVDSATGKFFQFRGSDDEINDVLRGAKEYAKKFKGIQVAKYYNLLGLELPDNYRNKGLFWGPKNEFNAWIEKKEALGGVFKVIMHEHEPLDPKSAGCPFAL